MTNKEYHSNKAIGSTMLSILLDNARKFKLIRDGELKLEGKAFDLGTVIHTKVLEPETADDTFVVTDMSISRRVKEIVEKDLDWVEIPRHISVLNGFSTALSRRDEVEAFKSENQGKEFLTKSEVESLKFYYLHRNKVFINSDEDKLTSDVAAKILGLPNFSHYVENGLPEQSFFATIDGVECKCRPDLIYIPDNSRPKEIFVFDVKSMGKEATSENFASSSANFNYFIQEALYRSVLEANGFTILGFLFAGGSTLEYSGANYFQHSEVDVEYGKECMLKGFRKYRYCLENDIWSEARFDFESMEFDYMNMVTLPVYVQYKYA